MYIYICMCVCRERENERERERFKYIHISKVFKPFFLLSFLSPRAASSLGYAVSA